MYKQVYTIYCRCLTFTVVVTYMSLCICQLENKSIMRSLMQDAASAYWKRKTTNKCMKFIMKWTNHLPVCNLLWQGIYTHVGYNLWGTVPVYKGHTLQQMSFFRSNAINKLLISTTMRFHKDYRKATKNVWSKSDWRPSCLKNRNMYLQWLFVLWKIFFYQNLIKNFIVCK